MCGARHRASAPAVEAHRAASPEVSFEQAASWQFLNEVVGSREFIAGPHITIADIFTFGAWYGWEIEKGKIGKMVGEINISGNVFTTLGNIVMIGNDFEMNEWGGCGKTRAAMYNMQMLSKSGTGGPHVKIENVVIGGR